ncbi:MAG: hypothetical protein ACJAQW_002319, partial [Paracoccaceae bacterium]
MSRARKQGENGRLAEAKGRGTLLAPEQAAGADEFCG